MRNFHVYNLRILTFYYFIFTFLLEKLEKKKKVKYRFTALIYD